MCVKLVAYSLVAERALSVYSESKKIKFKKALKKAKDKMSLQENEGHGIKKTE